MADELVMPRLSDTMERGTIARWVKQEGDNVQAGDVVAEIETDKATMEYQSDLDGVLLRILVHDGETADLGAPIAIVGAADETVADRVEPAADTSSIDTQPAPSPGSEPAAQTPPEPTTTSGGQLKASPIARRIADENGIDLRLLSGRGSGPDGRIVRSDVEQLLTRRDRRSDLPPPSPPPITAPAGATVHAPSRMQQLIARRMTEAKQTVPHFYLSTEIDMQRALEVRRDLNQDLGDGGVHVTVTDMIVRACGLALIANPQFHRSWIGDSIVSHDDAHVGVAVALSDGLIVPIVRSANSKPLRQIAVEARDLVTRARDGQLHQPEIEGATFSVSNLGMFGITHFAAIINPPEPGILAVGATVERPVIIDGAVTARPIMTVTLSVDHRATSGADGARFVQSVKQLLEAPLRLLS
jgi:pyruvate dehydrogenase E2 component (dihydrolipoamide acetyltransferase)